MISEERKERITRVTGDIHRLKSNAGESARKARREAAMKALEDENTSIDRQLADRESELVELTSGD